MVRAKSKRIKDRERKQKYLSEVKALDTLRAYMYAHAYSDPENKEEVHVSRKTDENDFNDEVAEKVYKLTGGAFNCKAQINSFEHGFPYGLVLNR